MGKIVNEKSDKKVQRLYLGRRGSTMIRICSFSSLI